MDERVWIGAAKQTPPGWRQWDSIEGFLSSSSCPEWIVLEDCAATFRQGDFLKVYEHCPLARIERVVGSWRAGIGRTDPAWPLVTTYSHAGQSLVESRWQPLTGGYDELAAVDNSVDLPGLSVAVQISDPDLREMWVDSLSQAGAEIGLDEAKVLITDQLTSRRSDQAVALVVRLGPDPWNANAREIGFQPLGACRQEDRLEAYPTEGCPREISASVLDSPYRVFALIARSLPRASR